MADGYRHELKYYITRGEAVFLAKRLSLVMDRDRNANSRGEYMVRSLYLDDMKNSAVEQKMSGLDERKKYRIRIYNYSESVIRLERKEKLGSAVRKDGLTITRAQCDAIIGGNPTFLLRYKHPLAMDLYYQMRGRRLKPAVIVDYTREAFVHPYQDVRITLDKNLHTGVNGLGLFNPRLPTVRALEDGDTILEVKFNRYLPAYFRQLVQVDAQRSAVSKYCICRKFE